MKEGLAQVFDRPLEEMWDWLANTPHVEAEYQDRREALRVKIAMIQQGEAQALADATKGLRTATWVLAGVALVQVVVAVFGYLART